MKEAIKKIESNILTVNEDGIDTQFRVKASDLSSAEEAVSNWATNHRKVLTEIFTIDVNIVEGLFTLSAGFMPIPVETTPFDPANA
jgi:hypothetical protein